MDFTKSEANPMKHVGRHKSNIHPRKHDSGINEYHKNLMKMCLVGSLPTWRAPKYVFPVSTLSFGRSAKAVSPWRGYGDIQTHQTAPESIIS